MSGSKAIPLQAEVPPKLPAAAGLAVCASPTVAGARPCLVTGHDEGFPMSFRSCMHVGYLRRQHLDLPLEDASCTGGQM